MRKLSRKSIQKTAITAVGVLSITGVLACGMPAFGATDTDAEATAYQSQINGHFGWTKIPEEALIKRNTPEIPQYVVNITDAEAQMLAKIAMAEAEGEDIKGKALVMNVILNRVESADWPNTIEAVIEQENQFSTGSRYQNAEPDLDALLAVEMIRYGWDCSEGAIYFEADWFYQKSNCSTWHSRNLEHLFTYGGHRFYK